MEIRQFVWDVVDSNSWLIVENHRGLLVDAVDADALYQAVRELDDLTIILTHCHFDHICGLNRIRELRPDVKVLATALCSEKIGSKYRNMSSTATAFMAFYNGSYYETAPMECSPADVTFSERHSFLWCGHCVELIPVHGHSDDSLIARIDHCLFIGDTLLSIPTVTRFPSGSSKRFWTEDVPLLKKLADIDQVYPGHGKQGELCGMLNGNTPPEKYREPAEKNSQ